MVEECANEYFKFFNNLFLESNVSSIFLLNSSTSLGSISAFSTISLIYTSLFSFCSFNSPIFLLNKSLYFSFDYLTFLIALSKSIN